MRVRLDYGADGLEVDLPDDRVTVIEPHSRPAVGDPHAALVSALRSPIGAPPLRELTIGGGRVAISVCDITRAQPRREMLEALFEEMPDVRAGDVTILVATGTHRGNTPAEIAAMLGADITSRYRVVNHDSRDPSTLVHVGQTATGAVENGGAASGKGGAARGRGSRRPPLKNRLEERFRRRYEQ